MSPAAEPKVYGWCPGALRPMMSGDGLVVRVRPPLGRLFPDQTRALAELSRRFGNGLFDLSARANLQMRGVQPQDHPQLIIHLQALGLVDADVKTEARRNLLLAPFWDPDDLTHRLGKHMSQALIDARNLKLPGKFGFAIDTGARPVLADISADIRLERGSSGLLLCADGAELGQPVTEASACGAALELARWFLTMGGAPEGRGRMRGLLRSGQASLPPTFNTPRLPAASAPQPGPLAMGSLIGLEFGQITADDLAALTDLGALRLTPWRMLLIEGVDHLPPLPGLITNPDDPRLRVQVCTGAPGCMQALSETRQLARNLAPHLPQKTRLHVSGCTKGCACPNPAPLVLTATAPNTFDLIRDGLASDPPHHSHLDAAQLRATPTLLTEGC